MCEYSICSRLERVVMLFIEEWVVGVLCVCCSVIVGGRLLMVFMLGILV